MVWSSLPEKSCSLDQLRSVVASFGGGKNQTELDPKTLIIIWILKVLEALWYFIVTKQESVGKMMLISVGEVWFGSV